MPCVTAPASALLWASPTPGQGRPLGYVFPWGRADLLPSPPCRVSQGSSTDLFLRAVPNHPGRPNGIARYFPAGYRLHPLWQTGHLHLASRGRIGFACATARRFAFPVSTRRITPPRSGSTSCTNEQSYMVNSFRSKNILQLDQPGLAWYSRDRRECRDRRVIDFTSSSGGT